MKINFYPVRTDESLEVHRNGAILTINGEDFDFTRMVDGDTLPARAISSRWFAEQVDNVMGKLELTLVMPIPAGYSPVQETPLPLLDVPNGPVQLPKPLAWKSDAEGALE